MRAKRQKKQGEVPIVKDGDLVQLQEAVMKHVENRHSVERQVSRIAWNVNSFVSLMQIYYCPTKFFIRAAAQSPISVSSVVALNYSHCVCKF